MSADLEQLAQAAGSDPDALQRLIVWLHPRLRGLVAATLDRVSMRQLDPEDVLQHAYIAAFEAIAKPGGVVFSGSVAAYKWLSIIALNEVRSQRRFLRRQKRDAAREVHGTDARGCGGTRGEGATTHVDLFARLAGAEATPSRGLRQDEMLAAVFSALARLTAEQRAVVQWRFLQGVPVAEIAARLGKTEDAVHALCYRAIKELRSLLGSITTYLTAI